MCKMFIHIHIIRFNSLQISLAFVIVFEHIYCQLLLPIKDIMYQNLDYAELTGDISSVHGIMELASYIGLGSSGNVTERVAQLRVYTNVIWQWIFITYG